MFTKNNNVNLGYSIYLNRSVTRWCCRASKQRVRDMSAGTTQTHLKGKAVPAVHHYIIHSKLLTEVEFVWSIDIMRGRLWTQCGGKTHSLQSKAWPRDDGWWAVDSPLVWSRTLDTGGDTLQTRYHSESTLVQNESHLWWENSYSCKQLLYRIYCFLLVRGRCSLSQHQ